MSVFLSPGVFSREIDLSLYIPNLSTTAYGVVGLASKGPINEPMYITDPVQFATTFGDPADPSVEFQPAVYSALQYLHTGRQLWFVRVAEFDPDAQNVIDTNSAYMAKFGTAALSQSSTAPKITGTVNTLVTLTASNNTMIFVVDGATPGFELTFSLGSSSSVVKTIPDIVALLNANDTFKTYMVASTSLTGSLVIIGKIAGHEHSIKITGTSMTNDIFGLAAPGSGDNFASAFGAGAASEAAYVLGANAAYPVTLTGSLTDTVTFRTGVSSATSSNVSYTFAPGTYTVAEVVQALNLNGTFNANLVASTFAGQLKVSIKVGSTFKFLALDIGAQDAGQYLFGEVNGLNFVLGNATFPYTIVTGENDTLVLTKNDFATPANDAPVTVTLPAGPINDVDSFVITLGSNGSDALPAGFDSSKVTFEGNDYIKISLTGSPAGFGLTFDTTANGSPSFGGQPFEKKNSTVAATTLTVTSATQGTWANNLSVSVTVNPTSFNLDLYEKSYLVESYRNLVVTPEEIPDPLAPTTNIPNPAFVENAINGVSARITVANSSGNTNFPLASVLGARYDLAGGTNGAPPSGTSDPSIYIGFSNNLQTTGLQFFRNPERLDINLISVPGVSDAAVLNEAIDICQTRGDAMAILDPPLGYTPQDVVDWVNGAGAYAGDHQAFNTSYAALYWPWLQIYDPINKKTVFTPPSGHLANVYAFTDLVSDPWIAPAGLTRGRLTTPLKAEYNPTTGERDLLYLNNINPIATFVRDGINVFGQKTLQRKPSALDRVNVRRLLLYLEKVITTAARQILFEPDDQITWLSFVNLVEPFMASVKSRRGLTQFEVRCDKTTNTPDSIDRSEMHALIFIKPTKAAEFIQVDFILTAQTANFSELVF